MKAFTWALVLIFIVAIFYLGTISKNNLDSLNSSQRFDKGLSIDKFPNSQELHWPQMPVTYRFDNLTLCGKLVPKRIMDAFNQIQNETDNIISFKEDNYSDSGITIYCFKIVPLGIEPGYIVSGEGGYSSQGNLIVSGTLNFYNVKDYTYSPGCQIRPNVEVHEIFHTFGIQHVNKTGSIMNPIAANCIWNIDEDIINNLKRLYNSE